MNSARILVLLLLVICLVAAGMTGFSIYYRLAYLWAVLWFGSWLMSVFALRGVSVQRRARTLRSPVGLIFEEHYEIINRSRLPRLWIEVRDESPLPGSRGSHVLTMIGGRETRSYLARTRLTDRGLFPLGPTVLASGDPFGLFPVSRRVDSPDCLLVYPLLVDVRGFPNPPGLLPGGEALRRRTQQITSNAAGVREYATGDPLNRIHWMSTARRNRLMVKEFELDPLGDVWLFVDAMKSVQAALPYQHPEFDPQDIWRRKVHYDLPPNTLEYSVCAAASLAQYYIENGRSLGIVFADQDLRVLPADRGGRQLGKALELLSMLQEEGTLPLQSLVEAQVRYLTRGSTVVMITPSTSEAVYRTADMVLRRGLRPIVVLVEAATFGGRLSINSVMGALQAMNVPISRIGRGDDLSLALSNLVLNRLG
jgi:uncharacterized protein (DUF58 family)